MMNYTELKSKIESIGFGEKSIDINYLKANHKFGTTQVVLPKEHADKIKKIAAAIPDEDLAEDGREDTPHVTVLFGIHGDDPSEIAPHISAGEMKLGKITSFNGEDTGKPYDVVKMAVTSPDLRKMNSAIKENVDNTQTFDSYSPHATLAYVKPGLGKKYAGGHALLGQTIPFQTVQFVTKDGEVTNMKAPTQKSYIDLRNSIIAIKGGSGSGNFGHAGIPGEQGGSASEGGGGEKTGYERYSGMKEPRNFLNRDTGSKDNVKRGDVIEFKDDRFGGSGNVRGTSYLHVHDTENRMHTGVIVDVSGRPEKDKYGNPEHHDVGNHLVGRVYQQPTGAKTTSSTPETKAPVQQAKPPAPTVERSAKLQSSIDRANSASKRAYQEYSMQAHERAYNANFTAGSKAGKEGDKVAEKYHYSKAEEHARVANSMSPENKSITFTDEDLSFIKGGSGSGNFGHAGREGERGGSGEGGGGGSGESDKKVNMKNDPAEWSGKVHNSSMGKDVDVVARVMGDKDPNPSPSWKVSVKLPNGQEHVVGVVGRPSSGQDIHVTKETNDPRYGKEQSVSTHAKIADAAKDLVSHEHLSIYFAAKAASKKSLDYYEELELKQA